MSAGSNAPLQHLLHHRPPMLLLDSVDAVDGKTARCSLTLASDAAFMQNGNVPAIVSMEYMAQCAAVCAAYQHQQGPRPVRGFLVGVRNMQLHAASFAAGETLRIEATMVWSGDDSAQFECQVTRKQQTVASATLSVVSEPNSSSGRNTDE